MPSILVESVIAPCMSFATSAYVRCAERNFDRRWYNRLFFGENCSVTMTRVFEGCKHVALETGMFVKPRDEQPPSAN